MEGLYCLIGFTLLLSSLSMILFKRDSSIFTNFNKILNNKQKKIYKKIINERFMIYFIGMILGLGLGIYYYINNPKSKYRLCKFLMIIYLVKFGFYYFYPKSPLILYSLTTKEQVNQWANIYNQMKLKYKKSLLIGFISYIFISLYFK